MERLNFNEINTEFDISQRLDLVNWLLNKFYEGEGDYLCLLIEDYILINGKSIKEYLRILQCANLNDPQFNIKSDTGDNTNDASSIIIMKLFLPELLKYKPETLKYDGGWFKDSEGREQVLLSIKSELEEKLKLKINQ